MPKKKVKLLLQWSQADTIDEWLLGDLSRDIAYMLAYYGIHKTYIKVGAAKPTKILKEY